MPPSSRVGSGGWNDRAMAFTAADQAREDRDKAVADISTRSLGGVGGRQAFDRLAFERQADQRQAAIPPAPAPSPVQTFQDIPASRAAIQLQDPRREPPRFGAYTFPAYGYQGPGISDMGLRASPDFDKPWLPYVTAGATRTPIGTEQRFSVGYDFLNYLRKKDTENTLTHQLTGRLGPLEAYYKKGNGETYGGSANLFPGGQFYGETTNNNKGFRGGVEGRRPLGPGILSGGVELGGPLDLSWTGKLGPLDFGLRGRYEIPSNEWSGSASISGGLKF